MRPLMLLRNLAKILAMDPCVVSDTHFFHDRIFSEFEPVRQTFASSRAEFDDKMIEVLRRSSPLLHLGDVTIDSRNPAVVNERVEWVTRRLRDVPKILLPGNHDRNSLFLYEKSGWKVVPCGVDLTGSPPRFYPDAPPFLLWNIDGQRVFFSHEPVLVDREESPHDKGIVRMLGEWFQRLGATLNIHGHTHSRMIASPLFRNVSLEAVGFSPPRLSQIVAPVGQGLDLGTAVTETENLTSEAVNEPKFNV